MNTMLVDLLCGMNDLVTRVGLRKGGQVQLPTRLITKDNIKKNQGIGVPVQNYQFGNHTKRRSLRKR